MREREQPDDVRGIALEDARAVNRDAPVFAGETGFLDRRGPTAQPAHETVENGARLGVLFLQRRADDGGEIADILGDEEIVLHEALDVAHSVARDIAETGGDAALLIE